MERFYVFIIRNDVWIYIVAALALLWYVNEYFRSRRILRQAMFGLEREKGVHIRNNALIFILVLSSIIAFVYYVNNNIAPTLPPGVLREPTPTPDIFATPLAPPTPLATLTPSPTPPLAPTVTLPGDIVPVTAAPEISPPPAETAVSQPTPTPAFNCTTQLNITNPANGAVVTGTVSFFGVVAPVEGFDHYILEANGPETNGAWANLLGREMSETVDEGFLGSVNLANWQPGPYLVRLGVVNSDDYGFAYCVIQITLE